MSHSIHFIQSLERIIARSNDHVISPRQTAILILEYIESLNIRDKAELLNSMKEKRPNIDKVARKYASLIGCQPDEITKFLRNREYTLPPEQINSLCSSSKYDHGMVNKNELNQVQ